MKKATLLISLCATLWVSGCAVIGTTQPSGGSGGVAPELGALPQEQVHVVLVRSDKDRAGVMNVFHGGRFHVSLRPGDFTVLSMCPSDTAYTLTSLDSPVQLNEGSVARLIEMRERLPAGQHRYYQVALREAGAIGVQPTLSNAVNWGDLTEQKRLVSRVQADCEPKQAPVVAQVVAPAVPAPVVTPTVPKVEPVAIAQPATLSIPSDLVFPFASYSLDDAVGGVQIRQRLEQFLKESGIREVESVVVKGHSDPIGQPHRKELVSGERAKAVAAYVTRTLNLPAAKVRPQAMSDRELLVTNCPVKPVAQRDACNAPNRRVELVVTGRR